MFGVDVEEKLFDLELPSMGVEWSNTPAFCCHLGLERMVKEFKRYRQQYEVNMKQLEADSDEELTGAELLKNMMIER